MKKFFALLAIVVLCAIIWVVRHEKMEQITQRQQVEESLDAKPRFSAEDQMAAGVRLGMEKGEVLNILGKPLKVTSEYEGLFGEDALTYEYQFGSIWLEPLEEGKHFVSSIELLQPGATGPRGIKVGDSVTSVLTKFPRNAVIVDGYQYGSPDGDYCYLQYNNEGKVARVAFSYNDESSGQIFLTLELENEAVRSIVLYAPSN